MGITQLLGRRFSRVKRIQIKQPRMNSVIRGHLRSRRSLLGSPVGSSRFLRLHYQRAARKNQPRIKLLISSGAGAPLRQVHQSPFSEGTPQLLPGWFIGVKSGPAWPWPQVARRKCLSPDALPGLETLTTTAHAAFSADFQPSDVLSLSQFNAGKIPEILQHLAEFDPARHPDFRRRHGQYPGKRA